MHQKAPNCEIDPSIYRNLDNNVGNIDSSQVAFNRYPKNEDLKNQ